jgi:YHS domain-containing protein
MMKCLVCNKPIDIDGAENKTGETAFGAKEIDPTKGTRQFHEGEWYYFDTLNCRTKFTVSPQRYLVRKG